MDREARRAYALSNLPPLAYTANEADFEARRGHAHSAPWQPETANSAAANAGPIKVDVASTVTGTVDGKAELAIHLTADSLLGGLSKMISSAINLSGGIRSDFGFAHGNQGESAHVPSPASSGHFGHN